MVGKVFFFFFFFDSPSCGGVRPTFPTFSPHLALKVFALQGCDLVSSRLSEHGKTTPCQVLRLRRGSRS